MRTALYQCAMCKDGLEQSADKQGEISPLAQSYNYSVLFLLALVFALMGAVFFKVWRVMRREDAKALSKASQPAQG